MSHCYALSRRNANRHEMWLAYPMLVGCAHTSTHKNRHKFPKVYLCEALVDMYRRMSLRVNTCTHKQAHGLSRPAGTSAEVGQPIGSGAGHAPRRDPVAKLSTFSFQLLTFLGG